MPSYTLAFLEALIITITIEMLGGWCLHKLLPKYFGSEIRAWRFYILIAVASFMTIPYVWFVWPTLIQDRALYLAVAETWVCLVEACFYVFAFKFNFKKALVFSLFLNGLSFGLGLLIHS